MFLTFYYSEMVYSKLLTDRGGSSHYSVHAQQYMFNFYGAQMRLLFNYNIIFNIKLNLYKCMSFS